MVKTITSSLLEASSSSISVKTSSIGNKISNYINYLLLHCNQDGLHKRLLPILDNQRNA